MISPVAQNQEQTEQDREEYDLLSSSTGDVVTLAAAFVLVAGGLLWHTAKVKDALELMEIGERFRLGYPDRRV